MQASGHFVSSLQYDMILLTGGTGFLGSYLLYELARTGKPLIATKRKGSSTEQTKAIWAKLRDLESELPPPDLDNIRWVEADLSDAYAWEEVFEAHKITRVYHAAAMVNFRRKNRNRIYEANVEGTAALVNASLHHGVELFTHVSSVAAIDRKANGATATEMDWITANTFRNPYSETKYLGEMEVWRGAAEGLPAVIINPGIILGWGDWSRGTPAIFKTVYEGLSVYPIGANAFVDARDVAKSAVALGQEPSLWGERYLCAGHNVSHQQLFEMISARFSVKAPSRRVGPRASYLAGLLSEWKAALAGNEPFLSREMARSVSDRYTYSSEKLLNLLPGFQFRPLAETIADTCAAYMAEIAHK